MHKCAVCGKEAEKIRKMTAGSTGKPPEGLTYGDTLIVLDVCEECYKKVYPAE